MKIKFKIPGLTDSRAIAPYINGRSERAGYVFRTVSPGRMENDIVRGFIFDLARTLKEAKVADFKLGTSPYFIGQTRLFWNWLFDNWRQQVKIDQVSDQKSIGTTDSNLRTQDDIKPDSMSTSGETGADAPLQEIIRKVDGQFQVQSRNGKNLGTYRSKSGAVKRLRQVEWHKNHPKEELGEAIASTSRRDNLPNSLSENNLPGVTKESKMNFMEAIDKIYDSFELGDRVVLTDRPDIKGTVQYEKGDGIYVIWDGDQDIPGDDNEDGPFRHDELRRVVNEEHPKSMKPMDFMVNQDNYEKVRCDKCNRSVLTSKNRIVNGKYTCNKCKNPSREIEEVKDGKVAGCNTCTGTGEVDASKELNEVISKKAMQLGLIKQWEVGVDKNDPDYTAEKAEWYETVMQMGDDELASEYNRLVKSRNLDEKKKVRPEDMNRAEYIKHVMSLGLTKDQAEAAADKDALVAKYTKEAKDTRSSYQRLQDMNKTEFKKVKKPLSKKIDDVWHNILMRKMDEGYSTPEEIEKGKKYLAYLQDRYQEYKDKMWGDDSGGSSKILMQG